MTDTFKCVICGGVFEKAWTDEEAEEQLKESYPGFKTEDCELACTDCYNLPHFELLREMRKK